MPSLPIAAFVAWRKLAVVAVVAAALSGAWCAGRASVEPASRLPAHVDVNDSTQADLAKAKPGRKDVPALKDAAKTLGGTLVAGVKLDVKPETLSVPLDTAPTTVAPDSTRTATLTDTTKGYTVTVTASAPPAGPLSLGYSILTPAFAPEVGFVEKDGGYYAVVSNAGQRFTTRSAFFRPPTSRPLSLAVGLGVTTDVDSMAPRLNAHAALRYRPRAGYEAELRGLYDGRKRVEAGVSKILF